MSYWYDFNSDFKVTPSAPLLINEIAELVHYWELSEDGSEIVQVENTGGNNSGFEDDLITICDLLLEHGHVVNGKGYYCGEETINSEVGIVEIIDNTVVDIEYGELFELLKKIYESD